MKKLKPTSGEWKALYEAAVEFKQIKCWEWMYDNDIFGVRDPETGEIAYCSIMGNLGENFALGAYLGTEGLESLSKIFLGEVSPDGLDVMFVQKCLMASFEDRDYLAAEDLKVIKKLGLKFRGKNAWPVFRNFTPGLVPWFIDAWECRFLTYILQQAIDVALRCKENKIILRANEQEEKFLVRVPVKEGNGIEWHDAYLEPLPYEEEFVCFNPTDEVHIKRMKTKPRRGSGWEVDTFFIPTPVREKGRPYYPKACLCLDHQTGMPLSFHVVSNIEDEGYEFLDMLVDIIENVGYLPGKLLVARKETFYLFKDLADRLEIEIALVGRLDSIEEAKNSMIEYLAER